MNEISRQQSNGKSQQFLVAIIMNLLTVSGGISCGWPSPVIPKLRSSDSPAVGDAPMNDEQISWISSLLPIGSLLITPFCGILSEPLGRKWFTYLAAISHIASWLLIMLAQNHFCLYIARLFTGVSIAMTIFILPMYVSEIACEDIRGALGGLMMFSGNLGVLIAYVAGAHLSYRLFTGLSLAFPLLFLVAFAPMPESPTFLMRRNRHLEAYKSLMFLRGNNKTLVEPLFNRLMTQTKISDSASKTIFPEYFNDRATRMGLIISFVLLGGQQLSGILAMLSYAETIFQRTGSLISSQTAPMIIGVIQIFASYVSTMLMDRTGRRRLTLISCFGMVMSHLLFGLFFNLQRHDYDLSSISWLPLVALSTYIAFYCLGVGPVPFVFTSEVFRFDVSSSATTLCYVFYWTVSSVAVKTFGLAMDVLGIDVCFFVLASFCAVCLILSYCLMPETKGRTREDIVDELGKHRRDEIEC